MRNRIPTPLLAAACITLAACAGGDSDAPAPASSPQPRVGGACSFAGAPATALPPGLDMTLRTGSASVPAGSPLRLELAVENASAHGLAGVEAGYQVDFWIQRGTRTIWLASAAEGSGTAQFTRPFAYRPHQRERFAATWDGRTCAGAPAPPGPYSAHAARLGPQGWWLAEPTSFEAR